MSIREISEKRQAQIRNLQGDWLEIIEKRYLDGGAREMTVWPDEEQVYFGTDEEFTQIVERYNLKQSTTGKRDTLWNTY